MLRGSTVNVDIFTQVNFAHLAFVGISRHQIFILFGVNSICPIIFNFSTYILFSRINYTAQNALKCVLYENVYVHSISFQNTKLLSL